MKNLLYLITGMLISILIGYTYPNHFILTGISIFGIGISYSKLTFKSE